MMGNSIALTRIWNTLRCEIGGKVKEKLTIASKTPGRFPLVMLKLQITRLWMNYSDWSNHDTIILDTKRDQHCKMEYGYANVVCSIRSSQWIMT